MPYTRDLTKSNVKDKWQLLLTCRDPFSIAAAEAILFELLQHPGAPVARWCSLGEMTIPLAKPLIKLGAAFEE